MTDGEGEAPEYATREAHTPDGTRVIAAFKPGSAVEHMTDGEFLAAFRKATGRGKPELRVVREDET